MNWSYSDFFDFNGCPCPEQFAEADYPWDLLSKIELLIAQEVQKNADAYEEIAEKVWIGKGTTIASGVRFTGPALFGQDCKIGPNSYIRENVFAGDRVEIGHCSEVKQAILFSQVQLPHFNYVGDSILGRGAHLGAGAIISNFKSTKQLTKVHYQGRVIETNLRKLGAILGDEVEIGCNAVLNPGTLVGMGSIVYPLSSVRGYIPQQMIYKDAQRIVAKVLD